LIQRAEPHPATSAIFPRMKTSPLSHRAVALQVAFERQTLKPVFHLIGYRLWFRKALGYGLWVNLIQHAEPHRAFTVLCVLPLSLGFFFKGSAPQPRAPIGRRRKRSHVIGSHDAGRPMGVMHSCTQPCLLGVHQVELRHARLRQPLCSAAGCMVERQTLKPVFSLDRL
jgi:hypothetical protein